MALNFDFNFHSHFDFYYHFDLEEQQGTNGFGA